MPPKGRGRESHGPIEGKQGTTAQCLAHAVLSNLLYKTLLIITPQIHITVHYLRYWWLSKIIVIPGLKPDDRMSQILEDIKPEESRFCRPGT